MVTSDRRQYRIIKTLGKGGFGTVYLAELIGEGGFSKTVALKVLNPDVAGIEEVAQRLRDEARVLGLVRHRAIVQVDGLVNLENRWTVVMEYVEGADLKHLIRAGAIPAGPALEMVAEVSNGLRAAFEQDGPDGRPLCMIHRDLKPSNLTITARGEVKILDFGTARANFASREAKTQSLAFGTIDYMAPERLDFEDGPAGDVYAVGAILAEMLSGEKVGRTSPRPERHQAVRDAALERLESIGIQEQVIEFVRQMLAFEPEDRPGIHEVERKARELRIACGGPWLSDWSSEVVPGIMAGLGESEPGDLSGMTLIEGSGSRPRPHPPEPNPDPGTQWVRREADGAEAGAAAEVAPAARAPRPPSGQRDPASARRGLPIWAVAVVALLGLGAVGAGVVVLTQVGTDPASVPAEVEEPVVEAVPEVEPEVVEEVEPEVVEEVEPVVEPAAPVVRPKPVAPRPRPSAATGTWRVSGDVAEVELVSGGRRFGPGKVPVGSYTIEATFGDRGTLGAGSVDIREGESLQVNCVAAFAKCSVR